GARAGRGGGRARPPGRCAHRPARASQIVARHARGPRRREDRFRRHDPSRPGLVASVSLARPAVRKRHRRTEIRLALQMVALTTLVCAIAGWLAWQQVRVTLEEGLRDGVAHDLAEAETSLEGDSIAMEAILLGRGDRREAAARHRGTLDYFEVLEASG